MSEEGTGTIESTLGKVEIESPFGASSAIKEMAALGSLGTETPEVDSDDPFTIGIPEAQESEAVSDDEGEESTDEATEENVQQDEAEEAEEAEEEEADVPKLKGVHGDSEYEVPLDATFPVKINGKVEQVPLALLAEDYSGRATLRQHFAKSKQEARALAADRAAFAAEADALASRMKKATDQLKTNPFGVVEAVAEIAGEDESFFDVYIQQALAIAKTLQDLTPEQQKAVFATRKLEIAKKRLEAEKSQINESRAKTEQVITVQRQIETKMAELGISDPELTKAYEIVRDLDEAQGLEPLRLADLCFQYVMKVERPFQQVERVLPKVLPKEQHIKDLVEALVDIVREEPLTDSELTEIVKAYSRRSASSPTKGKAPAPSATKAPAKAKPKAGKTLESATETEASSNGFDPVSIDDILSHFNAY